MTVRRSALAAAWLAFVTVCAASHAPAAAGPSAPPDRDGVALEEALREQAPALRSEVLQLALEATTCASRQRLVTREQLLTIIDYSLPSTRPRLWVIDVASRRVLFEELVAHGRNSGENQPTRFSNRPGSLQTSLGLFVTADSYVGRNGYSLRLRGVEEGINHRAHERAIVIHGAPYVSHGTARALGRLGRSWGCPAVGTGVARELIDTIKGGSSVFAYYPDTDWLERSAFLGRCEATP